MATTATKQPDDELVLISVVTDKEIFQEERRREGERSKSTAIVSKIDRVHMLVMRPKKMAKTWGTSTVTLSLLCRSSEGEAEAEAQELGTVRNLGGQLLSWTWRSSSSKKLTARPSQPFWVFDIFSYSKYPFQRVL